MDFLVRRNHCDLFILRPTFPSVFPFLKSLTPSWFVLGCKLIIAIFLHLPFPPPLFFFF